MSALANFLLVLTATFSALMAGLFFAWSCSINAGLGRLSDIAYITAMQNINSAILNPLFFMVFFGAVILLPASTLVHYSQPISIRFWYLLAASIIYVVAVFGVTVFGNVPLNDALKNFQLQGASLQEIASQRLKFEGPWVHLNNIRTIGSIVSTVLVILACLSTKTPE
jgi:uncharacterized membrane protein